MTSDFDLLIYGPFHFALTAVFQRSSEVADLKYHFTDVYILNFSLCLNYYTNI